MGLTIHWSFQGPQKKSEAKAIIEKMRQRAMDLPFESVGDIVHFKGEQAQFDHDPPNGEYIWLKIQAAKPSGAKMAGLAGTVLPKRSSVSRSTSLPAANGWKCSWRRTPRRSRLKTNGPEGQNDFAPTLLLALAVDSARRNMPATPVVAAFPTSFGHTFLSAVCWTTPRNWAS